MSGEQTQQVKCFFLLSLAKIPSALNLSTFFHKHAKTSAHYEKTTKAVLDHLFPIQKYFRSRSEEPGASPAVWNIVALR